jgi:hypothetical protein
MSLGEPVQGGLQAGVSNHNAVRFSDTLQSGRKVRRLTNNPLLLRSPRSD